MCIHQRKHIQIKRHEIGAIEKTLKWNKRDLSHDVEIQCYIILESLGHMTWKQIRKMSDKHEKTAEFFKTIFIEL